MSGRTAVSLAPPTVASGRVWVSLAPSEDMSLLCVLVSSLSQSAESCMQGGVKGVDGEWSSHIMSCCFYCSPWLNRFAPVGHGGHARAIVPALACDATLDMYGDAESEVEQDLPEGMRVSLSPDPSIPGEPSATSRAEFMAALWEVKDEAMSEEDEPGESSAGMPVIPDLDTPYAPRPSRLDADRPNVPWVAATAARLSEPTLVHRGRTGPGSRNWAVSAHRYKRGGDENAPSTRIPGVAASTRGGGGAGNCSNEPVDHRSCFRMPTPHDDH